MSNDYVMSCGRMSIKIKRKMDKKKIDEYPNIIKDTLFYTECILTNKLQSKCLWE